MRLVATLEICNVSRTQQACINHISWHEMKPLDLFKLLRADTQVCMYPIEVLELKLNSRWLSCKKKLLQNFLEHAAKLISLFDAQTVV